MTVDDPAFVEQAYAELMGRAVDPQGLADALSALGSGQSRERWRAALSHSGEARRAAGTVSASKATASVEALLAIGPDRVFVRRARRALLGHEGTESDVQAACQRLAAGASRLGWLRELRLQAATGDHRAVLVDVHKLDLPGEELTGARAVDLERLEAVTDEAFVFLAYRTLLGRVPDDTGRSAYLRRARAGEPRLHLLQEMAASPEGRARTARPSWITAPADLPLHARALRRLSRAVSSLRGAPKAGTPTQTEGEQP